MWPFKSKIEKPTEPLPCSSCVRLSIQLHDRDEYLKQALMENMELSSLRQTILDLKADLLKQKREQTEADLVLVSVKIIKSILDTGNKPPQLMNQQAALSQQLSKISLEAGIRF